MSFKVEFKSNYLNVKYGGELFLNNNLDDLKKLIINHPKKHIILDLLSVEEFQVVDSLVSFQFNFSTHFNSRVMWKNLSTKW